MVYLSLERHGPSIVTLQEKWSQGVDGPIETSRRFSGLQTLWWCGYKRLLENTAIMCTLLAVDHAEEYKGVRGWLLLLAISLTILDPIAIVLGVFGALYLPESNLEKYPEMLNFLLVSGGARLALAVFSIYAGVSLWRIQPGAPTIAKRYFQAATVYSALSLLLPRMVGLPDELHRQMAGASLVSSVTTLCYIAAWYTYLEKSKRVRATYEEKAPQAS